MYKDTFQNFIEINGLNNKILSHLKVVSSEKKRISDLEAKRNKAELAISELEKEVQQLNIKELEFKIANAENRLSKFKSQITMVNNEKELTAINHEIQHTELELKKLEVTYFINEEIAEKNFELIRNHKNFLAGSIATLSEIGLEVSQNIQSEEKEISNYKLRINALLEQLPASAKNLFLDVDKKFKGINCCSFLNHKSCSECRIAIDGSTINNVDRMVAIEQCPNCGRILLPAFTNF